MSKREFYGAEFYAYCQQQYDEARRYLKTCGRPADEYDRALISYHKETAALFSKFLDA